MTQFDVVVLGAGPGGYTAAIRCAQLGMKTALVEPRWWGGVTCNVGCIPTNALLHNAEISRILTHERKLYGITGDVTMDYGAAHTRSRAVSDRMVEGIHVLMRKNRVTEYQGKGRFRDSQTIAVSFDTGVVETLTFDNCVIATGSTPRCAPNSARGARVWLFDDFVMSPTLPTSVVICGAGPMGVEFACLLASNGTQVTLVEAAPRILPGEDPESSAEMTKALRALGVQLLADHRVAGVVEDAQSARVELRPCGGGEGLMVEAERVLMAVGVSPRTQGYGLETTRVELSSQGAIQVDERMATNVDHMYAVGDVTGRCGLASVAMAQGIVAAEAMAGLSTLPINYSMVPRVTRGQPQVASYGHTERGARELGHEVVVTKFPLAANGRAWTLGQASGFVKIVADATHGEILGVHMVGPNVGEMLPEIALAQTWDLTADEVARTIHPHPTLSEAVREAARAVTGRMIEF